MAATTIQGSGGGVTGSGFGGKAYSWSGTQDTGVVDVSGFTDGIYQANAATILSLSGSMAFVADSTQAPLATAAFGTSATLSSCTADVTLTAASGCTYSFNALLNEIAMSRPHAGRMEVTANFKNNGAVTESWTES